MRVIIAIWSDGRVECYSTVTVFLHSNPGRNYDTIMHHIQRLGKEKYEDEEVTLYRVPVTRADGGLKTKTLKKPKTKNGQ